MEKNDASIRDICNNNDKEEQAVEFVVFCGRLVAPENTTQEGTIYIYGFVSGRWFGVVWWCAFTGL